MLAAPDRGEPHEHRRLRTQLEPGDELVHVGLAQLRIDRAEARVAVGPRSNALHERSERGRTQPGCRGQRVPAEDGSDRRRRIAIREVAQRQAMAEAAVLRERRRAATMSVICQWMPARGSARCHDTADGSSCRAARSTSTRRPPFTVTRGCRSDVAPTYAGHRRRAPARDGFGIRERPQARGDAVDQLPHDAGERALRAGRRARRFESGDERMPRRAWDRRRAGREPGVQASACGPRAIGARSGVEKIRDRPVTAAARRRRSRERSACSYGVAR